MPINELWKSTSSIEKLGVTLSTDHLF